MKIIKRDRSKGVLFSKVEVGDIFWYDSCGEAEIFMKTPFISDMIGSINAVDLETGEYSYRDPDDEVFLIEYEFRATI